MLVPVAVQVEQGASQGAQVEGPLRAVPAGHEPKQAAPKSTSLSVQAVQAVVDALAQAVQGAVQATHVPLMATEPVGQPWVKHCPPERMPPSGHAVQSEADPLVQLAHDGSQAAQVPLV